MAEIVTKTEKFLLILAGAGLLLSAALTKLPEKAMTAEPVTPIREIRTEEPASKDALWLDMGQSIDLNHADAKELEALPGIGETLARRIVKHRSVHGPFRRVEDLMQVDGIHENTLEDILAVATVRDTD